ncbi:GNAT family N-acetyltransferase [Marivivens sp. LCG002]|uniref:GNAT family N-acetyltransferase n=1 Tax=Marivivens sp. LCG002 TaxID=3051171 RepID=UPI002555228C|nr:GNAT family N-acetyltransferase [Marivivens sp. LCG002]WIV51406.1 GNAT family N-acetyltransferase [Marivivens sp. LCG002]
MTIKPEDICYRVIETNEFETVSAFHREVGSQDANTSTLMWQYRSTSLPMEGVIVGAFLGDRLIGTQALIPMIATLNGQKLLSAKSEYTLLDPVCRGLGVFASMYKVVFEWARDKNIACIWGFTSAIKPFEKAGFQIGNELFDEVIVLKPFSYLLNRVLKLAPKSISRSLIEPKSMDSAQGAAFEILRDERYFNYRYFENPYRNIVWFDKDRSVLYTAKPSASDLFISEITDPELLKGSLIALRKQNLGSGVVRRITTHPTFDKYTAFPSLYKRTASGNFIVYKWLDREAEIPAFTVDEGHTQGVA